MILINHRISHLTTFLTIRLPLPRKRRFIFRCEKTEWTYVPNRVVYFGYQTLQTVSYPGLNKSTEESNQYGDSNDEKRESVYHIGIELHSKLQVFDRDLNFFSFFRDVVRIFRNIDIPKSTGHFGEKSGYSSTDSSFSFVKVSCLVFRTMVKEQRMG